MKLNPNAGVFVPPTEQPKVKDTTKSPSSTTRRYSIETLISLRELLNLESSNNKSAIEKLLLASAPDIVCSKPKKKTKKKKSDKNSAAAAITLLEPDEEYKVACQKAHVWLNKLSRDNLDTISRNIKQMSISYAGTLEGLVTVIFDRAISEPLFCDLYASLCTSLSTAGRLPEFREGVRTLTFRRLLLNKCYDAMNVSVSTSTGCCYIEDSSSSSSNTTLFNFGQCGSSNNSSNSSSNNSNSSSLSKTRHRQGILGNVVFLGELFRRHVLTENIMHLCLALMLEDSNIILYEDEESKKFTLDLLEAVCRLLLLVGDLLDYSSPASRNTMDEYFVVLSDVLNDDDALLPPRIKFLIEETIELRAQKWMKGKNRTTAVVP